MVDKQPGTIAPIKSTAPSPVAILQQSPNSAGGSLRSVASHPIPLFKLTEP